MEQSSQSGHRGIHKSAPAFVKLRHTYSLGSLCYVLCVKETAVPLGFSQKVGHLV